MTEKMGVRSEDWALSCLAAVHHLARQSSGQQPDPIKENSIEGEELLKTGKLKVFPPT